MKRLLHTILFFVILALFISPFFFPGTLLAAELSMETKAWLKSARLGPYAPATFSKKELYEKAKKEREVNIYSYSSRVFKFGPTFEKKYPGIKVNGFDIDSGEIITKILAEQRAGSYLADIVFMADLPAAFHELLDKNLIFNYVPPDIKDKFPKTYRDPLLIHHLSFDVVVYNTEAYKTPPIDSLWDLTRKEWKGKVLFPDPMKMTEYLGVLATIVQHGDEMSQAYEKEFGKPIKLSKGIPNAGYEWIKRLLGNDIILGSSTKHISKAVGHPGQKEPPIGLTAFSRLRDKKKDPKLVFDVIYDLDPVMAVGDRVLVAIANQAAHPNAAKLLIRWMMGDKKGGLGYKPYFVPGNVPTRTDVPAPPGTRPMSELKVWDQDPRYVWDHALEVRDFWIAHLK